MPCVRIKDGFLCGPGIYEWRGCLFEVHSHHGPWPLKRNGNPKAAAGAVFWDLMNKWKHVPNKEKFRK